MNKVKKHLITIKKKIIGFKKKVMRLFSKIIYPVFVIIPDQVCFSLITLTQLINTRTAFYLARILMRKSAEKFENKNYQICPTFIAKLFPYQAALILFYVGAFREAERILRISGKVYKKENAILMLMRAYFEIGEIEVAKMELDIFTKKNSHEINSYLLGLLELFYGNEKKALSYLHLTMPFQLATWCPSQKKEGRWCPHQNIAARYPEKYFPTPIDFQAGDNGLLFDAYNFLGQRLTHVGRGDVGVSMFAKAFEMQRRLKSSPIKISDDLKLWLQDKQIDFTQLRILPWEWVTQIGHQGMLDILFRMRKLGWWSGRAVILIPPDDSSSMVANKAILPLYSQEAEIIENGVNVSHDVYRELFSLQRYCGFNFNVWEFANGDVLPWQHAGAQLIRQWEKERSDFPLRDAFDQQYSNTNQFEQLKKKWGMSSDDWYVCLHLRDAHFYGEMHGTGQTHRNSDVNSYLDAVRFITEKGGWVIKVGGKLSPPLPDMERVVDYARSNDRTELLDLFLLRYARYFIGTISGLNNIAVSFNVPCAMVNCITVDAQLWSNQVRFIPKRISLSDQTYLTQRQLTSAPWRWRMFQAEVLRHHGASLINNTSDEILEIVKEVDSIASGSESFYKKHFKDSDNLIQQWQNSLTHLDFYGSATPSLYFLKKYQDEFLDHISQTQITDRYFSQVF